MKRLILYFINSFFFILYTPSYAQNEQTKLHSKNPTELFLNQNSLLMKLSFSRKDVKRSTNDSTYIKIDVSFKDSQTKWNKLGVKIRKRGNYRLKNCYLPPIKIKISKSDSKGTLFEGNKKLKLILPCATNKTYNDFVLKEILRSFNRLEVNLLRIEQRFLELQII